VTLHELIVALEDKADFSSETRQVVFMDSDENLYWFGSVRLETSIFGGPRVVIRLTGAPQ
jgi:hypothetical protein